MQPPHSAPLRFLPPALAAVLALAGCGDQATTETGSTAQVRVSATNTALTPTAPGDTPGAADAASMFSSVVITVSRVYLVSDQKEEVQVPLLDGNSMTLDLMNLDGELPVALADATVPAGRYSQLRIVVDNATVTLAEGLTFEGGESVQELTVPSGSQTGIKVNLLGSVEADAGSWSSLLVDFDVSRNRPASRRSSSSPS
jgi:hypothetical protein